MLKHGKHHEDWEIYRRKPGESEDEHKERLKMTGVFKCSRLYAHSKETSKLAPPSTDFQSGRQHQTSEISSCCSSMNDHEGTVFNIRMVDLIADNMVKPGKDVLSIKSGNNTYTGSLKADGFIHFEHLDLPCKSPGAFATAALRLSKPDLASCNGWTTIFYEGKPLDFYRKQLLGQMAEGVDGEVTSTRKEAPTAAAAAVPAAAAGGPSGVQEDNERVPLDPASVTPGDNSETSRKRKAVLEAARVQEESNKKARLASEAFKKAYEDLVEAERADLERAKKIMNQKAKLTKEGRLRAYSAKEAANMATDEAEAAEGLAKAAKEAAKRAEEIAEKQQLLLQQQEADEVAATDHVKAKMADLRAVEEAARRLGTA